MTRTFVRAASRTLRSVAFVVPLAIALFDSNAHAEYLFQALDIPGAVSSVGFDLNERGEVLGSYRDEMNAEHYFILDALGIQVLNLPSNEPLLPTSFNSQGVVAGMRFLEVEPGQYDRTEGFLYDGVQVHAIRFPGAASTSIGGINDRAIMVGEYSNERGFGEPSAGFIFDGLAFREVAYPGATHSGLTGINSDGSAVVGAHGFPIWRGFLYAEGDFSDIVYPGSEITIPSDVNDVGTIVGSYTISFMFGGDHGFVFKDNEYELVHFPGARETGLAAVDNSGRLLGTASFENGQRIAFLAVPIPEPSPSVMAVGFVTFLLISRVVTMRLQFYPGQARPQHKEASHGFASNCRADF